MTQPEFLEQLQDLLQTDDPLSMDSDLTSLEEWDSLAVMVLIAFYDKEFKQKLKFEDFQNCGTPHDLARLAAGKIA